MADPEATNPPLRRSTDLPSDAPWWARWFVANIKEAGQWASVRFGAIIAVLAEVYAADPAGVQAVVKDWVPISWWPHIVAGAFVVNSAWRIAHLTKSKLLNRKEQS